METRTDTDLDDCNPLSITGAGEFAMMVGVDKDHFRLDPSKAIGIPLDELIKLAGKPLPTAPDPTGILEEPVFAPRWPTVVSDGFALLASWDEPPFAQKITTCLQNGPLKFAQLVAATNAPSTVTLARTVKRLRDEGTISRSALVGMTPPRVLYAPVTAQESKQ